MPAQHRHSNDAVDPFPELSPAELDLMKVFWERGRLSAREAHEAFGAAQGWAYSTTRTTVERMVKKGALEKRPFHGLNVYAAAISRAQGLASRVRDFAERVVELPWAPVVSLFAASEALAPEEIKELSELLAQAEGDER